MSRYSKFLHPLAISLAMAAPVFAQHGSNQHGGGNYHSGGGNNHGGGDYHHGDDHHGGYGSFGFYGVPLYGGVYFGSAPYGYDYRYRYGPRWNFDYYSAPLDVPMPATIVVRVPADAKVWFDDTLTQSTGESRSFGTPPLNAGSVFHYTIRAQWNDKGQMVDRSQQVDVMGGRTSLVDFTQPRP